MTEQGSEAQGFTSPPISDDATLHEALLDQDVQLGRQRQDPGHGLVIRLGDGAAGFGLSGGRRARPELAGWPGSQRRRPCSSREPQAVMVRRPKPNLLMTTLALPAGAAGKWHLSGALPKGSIYEVCSKSTV